MTTPGVSEHQIERERQVVRAFRALLKRPLLRESDEDFVLVRRHVEELRRRFGDLLGYELVVRARHARLRKHPVAPDVTRPLRVAQPHIHPDRRRPFTRRHYALMCLTCAALQRSASQTTIALLADDVVSLARESGMAVDFDDRAQRRVLAEAIDPLVDLGALRLVDGDAHTWVAGDDGHEISLYDVDHGVLADTLAARDITACRTVADVVARADDYPPTDDGRNRRLRHRVARRLVEDPVLYFLELDSDEDAYYRRSQRPTLDPQAARFCGLVVEARAEGTALVDPAPVADRALTDLRFPYNVADRQVALLLCAALAEAHNEGRPLVTRANLLRDVQTICDRYQALERHRDSESRVLLLDDALSVLFRMRLAAPTSDGAVLALPALARFADADVRDHRTADTDGAQEQLL